MIQIEVKNTYFTIFRKNWVNNTTILFLGITIFNLVLWLNFISNVLKKREDTNIKCVADFFFSLIQYYIL